MRFYVVAKVEPKLQGICTKFCVLFTNNRLVKDFAGVQYPLRVKAVFDASHELKMAVVKHNVTIRFLNQANAMLATDGASKSFAHFKNTSNG